MEIFRKYRRKALWIGALMMAVLVIGCAGIEPYEPRNNREEGPERGLFSGSDGEFVIFRKEEGSEAESGANNSSDETEGIEQQKMESEDRK